MSASQAPLPAIVDTTKQVCAGRPTPDFRDLPLSFTPPVLSSSRLVDLGLPRCHSMLPYHRSLTYTRPQAGSRGLRVKCGVDGKMDKMLENVFMRDEPTDVNPSLDFIELCSHICIAQLRKDTRP